jgi:acyl carrier protein
VERNAVADALVAAISDVLEREVGSLTEHTRLSEDLHLDSTLMLELLMALEETFELDIEPESLDIEHFATVGSLTRFVERSRRDHATTT